MTIVGIGLDGAAGLGGEARAALDRAEIIVTSRRLKTLLPPLNGEIITWPEPFDPMIDQLKSWRDRKVVIAATGDPMWFGIGATLAAHFDPDCYRVLPAPSAFSLAASRMGWPLGEIHTISLHGRPVSAVEPFIQPGARILALTTGAGTLQTVAGRLCDRGFGHSCLTALENLGGKDERRTCFQAETTPDTPFGALLTLAIECIASPGANLLSAVPGLPDEAFIHDGQLTKREVRAATLAALMPAPGALLWDIGAGCGSIAIEWLRAMHGARAMAFERDRARIALIRQNMDRLGTPGLDVIQGVAPEILGNRQEPDAVFIGGGVAESGIITRAWDALKPGGRAVANAVTLEGEAQLARCQDSFGGDLVRMAITRLDRAGTRRVMRPLMTVTQWRAVKT